MDMRRKITGALAWAGLVIVVAVPAAELIWSKLAPADTAMPIAAAKTVAEVAPKPATKVPAVPAPATAKVAAPVPVEAPTVPAPAEASTVPEPGAPAVVETAAQDMPAEKPVAEDKNPLGNYLESGKKLPDYITGSTSTKPAPAASVEPPPALPQTPSQPAATRDIASTTPAPAAVPAATEPVAPNASAAPTATVAPVAAPPAVATAPVPLPAAARPKPAPARTVTEADLKNWKSGSLEDYLKQQGLLSNSDAAPASN